MDTADDIARDLIADLGSAVDALAYLVAEFDPDCHNAERHAALVAAVRRAAAH